MMKRLAIAVCTLGLAASAQAADQYIYGFSGLNGGNTLNLNGSTNLSAYDSGWYFQDGTHNTSNTNYIVGMCTSCGLSGEYRNWFAFNLAGITSPVSSASFTLYSYSVTLTSGNYYLNDYNGSVASLTGGTGGVGAFNDIGSGLTYGFRFYQNTESNQFHTISLNSGALASLNSAIANHDSTWAMGGSFLAGDTPVPPNPVPEPGTLGLLALGLTAFGALSRRRRR